MDLGVGLLGIYPHMYVTLLSSPFRGQYVVLLLAAPCYGNGNEIYTLGVLKKIIFNLSLLSQIDKNSEKKFFCKEL